MSELLAEPNPADEHLSELAAGFVGCGTKGRCTLALGVFGPPSHEDSIVVADFLGGRPRKGSIQPALNWKLSRRLPHAYTITLATGLRHPQRFTIASQSLPCNLHRSVPTPPPSHSRPILPAPATPDHNAAQSG